MKIKTSGKLILFGLIAGGLFCGKLFWWDKRPQDVGVAQAISSVEVAIPDAPEASISKAISKMTLPTKDVLGGGDISAKWNVMAWQSQNGLVLANGGARTTKESLLGNNKWDLSIVRQDDCMKSCAEMVSYIQSYAKGETKDGFFITFMGSGIPNYITGISNNVKDLGEQYQPVAFLTFGKSFGEDQVIGDLDIKNNPQLLKGKVLRGVKLDGDIDIALKFCAANNIKVNPNNETFDKTALNLSYCPDFVQAAVDYNNGYTEKRKVVAEGKTTGKDTTVKIDLVATWTPGDVTAINGRGGATIISTKQYASMMPNITITCKKFLYDNPEKIKALITSLYIAGDQIRNFEDIKKYACSLNADVYGAETVDYWARYYNGVKKDEHTTLGGSMVFNMNDAAHMFGLNGDADIYKAVYNTFGSLQTKMYKEDFPSYLSYEKAVDKTFMRSVYDEHPELLEGKALIAEYKDKMTEKISSKNIQINFETGSDVISADSYDDLNAIIQDALTSDGLKFGIYGYTDNVGDTQMNLDLSRRRAKSVATYLIENKIPAKRLESDGFGEERPVASNSTESGKAQNRRVEIVVGQ
jgi:OOP family OmpA-OmpF porin